LLRLCECVMKNVSLTCYAFHSSINTMSVVDVNESLQSQGSNVAEENGETQRQRLVHRSVIVQDVNVDLEDESSVKRLILNFEKIAAKNQELRIKYPNDPIQFLHCDFDLYMTIRDLHCLSSAPQFYALLVRLNAVSILCQLLLHPKCIIGAAVADLLLEMIEIGTEPQYLIILIDALMDAQAPQCLLTNLKRLNENNREDAISVYSTIAVLESMIENTTTAADVAVQCGYVQWLLNRLKMKIPFDDNKVFCNRILGILLKNSDEGKKVFHENNGIDILLEQLAGYKRRDLYGSFKMQNMVYGFISLCASLLYVPNKHRFREGEGFQVVLMMIRKSKTGLGWAFKTLNDATISPDSKENCNKLVEVGGLGTIFAFFMRPVSRSMRKYFPIEEQEKHVCSILSSLLKYCDSSQQKRVMKKFSEKNFEKLKRLAKLHKKYWLYVRDFEKTHTSLSDDNKIYLDKLQNGLSVLQSISFIFSVVLVKGDNNLAQQAMKLLAFHQLFLESIQQVLKEYAENLGLHGESKSEDKPLVETLIKQLDRIVYEINTMSAINVNEILQSSIKPTSKRSNVAEQNGESKRQRLDHSSEIVEDVNLEPLNESSVRRLILNFEKMAAKNQEMRIKYPDDPIKFMDSEVELNVAIQELHSLATVPQFYTILARLNTVSSLCQLLLHPNSDIAVAVTDLFYEMTDIETESLSDPAIEILIDALMDAQAPQCLLRNLKRLNEDNPDEAAGVHSTMAVLENMIDMTTDTAGVAVQCGYGQWLLNRLKMKIPFDENKLYCSELLGILLQNSDECKKVLHENNGIDILLEQLAGYKRRDPYGSYETEYMLNVFNCLCASLLYVPNKHRFREGEGFQLMLMMLREYKIARGCALKTLDYATTSPDSKENCNKLVEVGGLGTIFPLFMHPPSRSMRKYFSIEEHEEHVCSILSSLLKYCDSSQQERVIKKFSENNFEKLERLAELHKKYWLRMRDFEKTHTSLSDDNELYFDKLENGLFTLQSIGFIFSVVLVKGDNNLAHQAMKLLALHQLFLKSIQQVLKEYAENLGLDGESKSEDRALVETLIKQLDRMKSRAE
ncbi:Beta-catenin-like protein 1, partial [Trichinella nelsoni]